MKPGMHGLMLIEVLIALAIISIALTAIIKAASEHIRATAYLEKKTIALWAGGEMMNEIRAGLIALPEEGQYLNNKTQMLGQEWYLQVTPEQTPNPRIKKIIVRVYANEPTTEADTSLIELESYVYQTALPS